MIVRQSVIESSQTERGARPPSVAAFGVPPRAYSDSPPKPLKSGRRQYRKLFQYPSYPSYSEFKALRNTQRASNLHLHHSGHTTFFISKSVSIGVNPWLNSHLAFCPKSTLDSPIQPLIHLKNARQRHLLPSLCPFIYPVKTKEFSSFKPISGRFKPKIGVRMLEFGCSLRKPK